MNEAVESAAMLSSDFQRNWLSPFMSPFCSFSHSSVYHDNHKLNITIMDLCNTIVMILILLPITNCFVLYTGAVHRFYESRRRLFNDGQPGRVEAAIATKKNSKQAVLRKQVIVVLLIEYCMCGLVDKKLDVVKSWCIPLMSL